MCSFEDLVETFPKKYLNETQKQLAIKRANCLVLLKKLEEQNIKFTDRSNIFKKFEGKHVLDLLKDLKNGKLSLLETYANFLFKTIEIDAQTNAVFNYITESFEQILEKGKNANKDRPLFGLPVSIKDTYDLANYPTTYGVHSLVDNISKADCYFIEAIKEMGAIPFVITTVSEACSSYFGENKVTGRCQHSRAYNADKAYKERTPGGSSTGEGVLVACGGSPIGFGSDAAGSIRIPAGFNGLCGMRISTNRISNASPNKMPIIGTFSAPDYSVIGPITKDAKTMAFIMKHLFAHPTTLKRDPYALPLPFQQSLYTSSKKLRIGYFWSTKAFSDPGYLKRSVDIGIGKLTDRGHECVNISDKMPDMFESFFTLGMSLICVDGGKKFVEHLSKAGPCYFNEKFYKFLKLPNVLKAGFGLYLKNKDPLSYRMCEFLSKEFSVYEYMDFNRSDLQDFKSQIHQLYVDNDLDLIMMPLWETAAELYDSKLEISGTFTVVTALTNFPIGAVAVTNVTENDVKQVEEKFGAFRNDTSPSVKFERGVAQNMDEDAIGLPLALQLMAPPFNDEVIIRGLEIIDQCN